MLAAFVTSLVVVGLSYGLPDSMAATGVGLAFLGATYLLALRRDSEPAHYGLSLGGLLEPDPLSPGRLARAVLRALLWGGGAALVIFPPFWFGWLSWWKPPHEFVAVLPTAPWDELLGQFLVIALPEEAFYRGYLMTALDDAWKPRWRVLGALVGPGLLVSSVIFALGHLATDFNPNRLAVFFPSLVFGWLRARTGSIGGAVVFHALANLFTTFLARSYGLIP